MKIIKEEYTNTCKEFVDQVKLDKDLVGVNVAKEFSDIRTLKRVDSKKIYK